MKIEFTFTWKTTNPVEEIVTLAPTAIPTAHACHCEPHEDTPVPSPGEFDPLSINPNPQILRGRRHVKKDKRL